MTNCPFCGNTADIYLRDDRTGYCCQCSGCMAELSHEDKGVCGMLWDRRDLEHKLTLENTRLKTRIRELEIELQATRVKHQHKKYFEKQTPISKDKKEL